MHLSFDQRKGAFAGAAVILSFGTAAAHPTSQPHDRAVETFGQLKIRLGPTFRETRAGHFVFLSDADASHVRELHRHAKSTYEDVTAFAGRLGFAAKSPRSPLPVVFFEQWRDYASLAEEAGFHVTEAVPGFFDERGQRCILFNFKNAKVVAAKRREVDAASSELVTLEANGVSQEALVKRRRQIEAIEKAIHRYEMLITATVMRHEIAHQVLVSAGLQMPHTIDRRWLREGLAMQFESPGESNVHRRQDFLLRVGSGRPLRTTDLVGDAKYLGPGAADASARYAEAWALVRYLVEQKPRAMRAYLRFCRSEAGRAGTRAEELRRFETHFGKLDAAFVDDMTNCARRMAGEGSNEPD